MDNNSILEILEEVVHPEYGVNIVELGMVENLIVTENEISFSILTKKIRDPFATKLKRYSIDLIGNKFPEIKNNINILIKEPAPKKPKQDAIHPSDKNSIRKIIAISSCKGGVGKSTVTANLAITLALEGYSVGVIDADVYGPSMPKLFGVEGYTPVSNGDTEDALILPAERYGVKVMSIGFFIKDSDALVWRGPMATNALKQLIHQTAWGELDFLLIDLPPGTGDIHLTVLSELKINGAVIVSTPQELAIADVVRGIEMFKSPHVNIDILGLVENMSWFAPKEAPDNKYYIFGKDGCKNLAAEKNIPLLAQIPIIMGNEEEPNDKAMVLSNNLMFTYFHKMVEKLTDCK